MRIVNTVFCALLIVISAGGSVEAEQNLQGRALLYGEVLASACSIALNDRFQAVPMGDISLRDIYSGKGAHAREFSIHLENCMTPGEMTMEQKTDPSIRVRFDGLRGSHPALFRTLGEAKGITLLLRDERQEIVYPGVYLPAVYQKAYNQQVMKYRVELVSDGEPLSGGDYSAALRFSVNYE